MRQAPSGTITFLFTDLEGSTRLWEERTEVMRAALTMHDDLMRDAIESHDGHLVKSTGDGVFAVFANAHDGVAAAIAAQLALAGAEWPEGVVLRARMGLHVGPATEQDGDYFGPDVNRTARLMSVAHGNQIICSRPVGDLVRDRFTLVDLGEHRLRDLQSSMHVFQVDVPESGSVFPPLRSMDALPGNLPRQVTTFVGRESLIGTLGDLVREASVLTLTGVGGVGKTRLALQVAADVVTDFPDGAWLCEYASVVDAGAVWEAVAASLRVQALPGRTLEESVLEYLAAKRLLLVLDNCEHLLDPIARQAEAITQRCPGVSVLATSREGLGLAGERIVAVPSLRVPADETDVDALIGADAVQLFSDRATAANADFVLSAHNATSVAVLCRRLDGIPLAIELAAARARSLSPEDLVGRLDQRFRLLSRGGRAALERHQTLRSTIDWSYDLLDPIERHALDCLSVFAGSCDLAAAERVLATDDLDELDVVDVLGQLVDKSLVVADSNSEGGGTRYRLLESIRQYAGERLEAAGSTAAVRQRYADHYVGVAEGTGPHLRNHDQLDWAKRALRDADNFRAVLDWSLETPSHDHALRLVAPFTVTGMAIGDAAQEWAETVSTMPGVVGHALFPDVASFAALAATFVGDLDRAEARVAAAGQSQEALGTSRSPVLRALAVLAIYQSDLDRARVHAQAWVEIARASGDAYELAHALLPLAATYRGEREVAIALLDETIAVARAAKITSALAIALPFQAGMLPIEDTARSLALLDEAIEVSRRLGDRLAVSLITATKGGMAFQHGDFRTALSASVEVAEQKLELGDVANINSAFYLGGLAFYELGHPEPALVLIANGDTLAQPMLTDEWTDTVSSRKAALQRALGEQEFRTLVARGAALATTEAAAYLRGYADDVLPTDQT